MYLSVALALLVFLIYRSIIFGYGVAEAGYKIFFKAFDNLAKRPIQFFDTTPVGQILGRLVNDQNDTDTQIPAKLNVFLSILFTFLGAFVLLCIVSPYHTIIIVLFFVMIGRYMKKYVLTTTELKRMNKIADAPVISTLTELVSGSVLIRNYGQVESFKAKMVENLDLY